MATPFLDALFARFASSEVHLLMYKHLHAILDGGPWTENCHFWPAKSASKDDKRTFIDLLKAKEFDLAILLPNSFRVAWMANQIGAKRRVGFSRDARGWLLTDPLPVPNRNGFKFSPLPLVEYYDTFAKYLGCPVPGDNMSLYTVSAEDGSTQQRLAAEGISGPIVTLCPGANFGASKCWHPERFAGVADELVRNNGANIVISPGPGEEPLAERISETMTEKSYLLTDPCLTLGELKSLIKSSVLLIGNDTGPRHYARAFDVPRVTIFGPTEQRWTDTSHDKETIVKVDVPCGPCQKKVCPLKERICMDRITVADVYEASRQYVN